MTLQAAIFDVDGTLADTEEAHRQAFNATFKEFGLPWHWDVSLYVGLLAVAGGRERLLHYGRGVDAPRFAAADAADFVARLHERKTRRYSRLVEKGEIPARPGILRLITALQAKGVRLAIATTTSRANVDVLLRTTLATLPANTFEVIGAGEEATAKKPAPDIYRRVLDRLGLCGAECLAIEDSKNGVQAARGADIPVLVTVNPWTRGDDFSGALAVLDDLGDTDVAALQTWHGRARNAAGQHQGTAAPSPRHPLPMEETT